MSVSAIPSGHHSVEPYLIVDHVEDMVAFLQKAFGAEVIEQLTKKNGKMNHAQVKIGDSMLMMGCSGPEFPALKAMIHIYTPNVDKMYTNALAAGATTLMPPEDQFYGDRSAGVQGPQGNYWWIATHIEDVSSEEMQRRNIAREEAAE